MYYITRVYAFDHLWHCWCAFCTQDVQSVGLRRPWTYSACVNIWFMTAIQVTWNNHIGRQPLSWTYSAYVNIWLMTAIPVTWDNNIGRQPLRWHNNSLMQGNLLCSYYTHDVQSVRLRRTYSAYIMQVINLWSDTIVRSASFNLLLPGSLPDRFLGLSVMLDVVSGIIMLEYDMLIYCWWWKGILWEEERKEESGMW